MREALALGGVRTRERVAAARLLLGAASLAYGGLLVLLRGRPTLDSDAGVFLSVAGRILDGDRLYRDVWDNKDPLFFYLHAGALGLAGWRGPFLLDVVWVAVAAAATWLLLRSLGAGRALAAAGFVAYPLLLTGQWYYAGYSMTGALALAPLACWLWARGSPAGAGVAVAAGVLLKLNLALVLLAGPAALLALGRPLSGRGRALARLAAGVAAVLAVAAALLAVRGELVPYASTVRDNVAYASEVLAANGRPGGVHGHVRVVETSTRHARPVIAVFLLAAAAAVWTLLRRPGGRAPALEAVAALLVGVGGATALTLALTAAWDHHVQMLAYPGALLAALAAAAVERAGRVPAAPRLLVQAAAVAAVSLLLGAGNPPEGRWPLSRWTEAAHSRTAAALAAVRSGRLAGGRDVSYAHLGQNDEEGHAAFLDGGWTLACARFHQYPWTPAGALDGVLRCVDERRPELVLVTSSLSDREGAPAAWHRFVVRARALVARDYRRVYLLRHPGGTVAVWQRR